MRPASTNMRRRWWVMMAASAAVAARVASMPVSIERKTQSPYTPAKAQIWRARDITPAQPFVERRDAFAVGSHLTLSMPCFRHAMATRQPQFDWARHSFRAGERVAVAVSGGADSVALLSAMAACRTETGIVVSAVHVHHGLRGAEADGDEQFVAALRSEE